MSARDCPECGWAGGVNPSWCPECAKAPRWDPEEPYEGRSDRPLFLGDAPLSDEEIRALERTPTPAGWVLGAHADPRSRSEHARENPTPEREQIRKDPDYRAELIDALWRSINEYKEGRR
jgi:hypothetical protein